MDDDPISSASKILDNELVKNVLSPPTKEVGEFLATIANLTRYYATGNLEKIFTKWAKSRCSIEPEEFKRVMPLLPLVSMVSDDELQERWAVLMESTATDEGCLPSFGQTLAQLTAEEVRYLERLWKAVVLPPTYVSIHRAGRDPLRYDTLVQVLDPEIDNWISPSENKVFQATATDEQKAELDATYERIGRAELVIEDLMRLGIIGKEQVAKNLPFEQAFPSERRQTRVEFEYSFSQYGVSFMEAVTPKPEPEEDS